ncbi:predicted protein [Naegleria gruberi]|uniref:Predicted protein n=1 Tax=Naegleria gruberi TaxID=5762 RepID=D2V0C6_NAEGR|nr:uncharacterized protein NAEGRDRAFT_62245 [Naegleria gruberi]EFC49694.1 predicted protein [Naegleria gruberi]|eukprot:XP_002682438.1 predicted protein [Naegleria gruberi strain NEG-M]
MLKPTILVILLSCLLFCSTFLDAKFSPSDAQAIQDAAFTVSSGFAASAIVYPGGNTISLFSGNGDATTKVRIGDLTKLLVATQMFRMRDAGKLKLDDALTSTFSKFPISSVTLRQLSTHMSGLGRQAPCKLFDCNLSSDEVVKAMTDSGLPGHSSAIHEPYSVPVYSDFGYCWLSQALAKMNGQSVSSNLKDVMKSASMSNSGLVSDLLTVSTHVTPSYAGNATITFDSEVKSGWCEGSMDAYSTLQDLTYYASSILNDESILTRQTVREFFTPQYISPDAQNATGFAFEMSHDSKYNVWKRSKRGNVLGFSSHMIFVPEYKFAIISISSNRDVFATYIAEQIYAKAVGTLMSQYVSVMPAFVLPPAQDQAKYQGTYLCNADGTNATLYYQDGQTIMNINLGGIYVNFDLDYQPNNAFIIRDIQEAAYIDSLTLFKGGYGNEVLRFSNDKDGNLYFWMPGLDWFVAYTKISSDVNPKASARSLKSQVRALKAADSNPKCNILPRSAEIDVSTLQSALTDLKNNMVKSILVDNGAKNGSGIILAKYRDTVVMNQGVGQVGTKGKETETPTADSIFRVASVTKVFTSMAALIAQELGIIKSIDEPITNYVKDFQYTNKYFTTATNKITFRQLMIHGAGLSRTSPCDPYNCSMTFDEYRKATVDLLQFMAPSISDRYYSNVDFTILGRVLELITGKSFREFCKINIFDKLGMSNTGFDYTSDILSKMVVGRDPDYLTMLLAQEPAGGMYSTANDMLKFFSCFTYSSLNNANACPVPISKDAMRQFMPTFLANDATFTIGLGAFETMYDNKNNLFYLTKGGSVYGYNAKPLVVPELDFVMITLASLNSPVANNIALKNAPIIFTPIIEQLRKSVVAPAYPDGLLDRIQGSYTGYISSWFANGTIVLYTETAKATQNLGPSTVLKGHLLENGLSFYVVPVSQNGKVHTMKIKTNLDIDCATSTFSGFMNAPMVVDLSDATVTLSLPTLNFGNKFTSLTVKSASASVFSSLLAVLLAIASVFLL